MEAPTHLTGMTTDERRAAILRLASLVATHEIDPELAGCLLDAWAADVPLPMRSLAFAELCEGPEAPRALRMLVDGLAA